MVSNQPTADQFNFLAKAGPLFRDKLLRRLRDRFLQFEDTTPTEAEIVELVSFTVCSLKEESEAALGEEGNRCLDWLVSEPAFALASKTLGYESFSIEEWREFFDMEIRRSVRNKNFSASKAFGFASKSSQYLRNVSSIAKALSGYLSGARHREVLDGPATIQRMKELLLEFEQLVEVDWMPENLKESLRYKISVRSAIRLLDEPDVLESPVSRRNDADLPTRLLASELLRINYEYQRSFHKKAVFHLMGLSFIERPLEMRTIERLAKNEMDALREYVAKRIADKRGLDFDYVLTTLKTNKSLSLPD
ncbi:hypothetical protein ACSFE6_04345 [Pseudomonas baetica]|uniref:hypothetical protein n=1 Tax=Pseudomonas baetica TaxID=674054 RepID=UPI003EED620C